jgi:ABC-type branched-subunit amino acid transport system substrate-binding protein
VKGLVISGNRRKRKPSKKRAFVLMVCLLCVAGLAFFSGLPPFGGSTPKPGKALEPSGQGAPREPLILHPRIGVILPLSGGFQKEGEMLRDGISLAWKGIQAEGARAEVVIQDAGKERFEAIRVAREFAADPDTILVIVHLPTAVTSELIPVFEEAGVPLLAVANSHESLTNHRWVIPFLSSDHTEGVSAAGLAAKWAKEGGATVIHDPGPYGMILSAGFQRGAEKERFPVKAISCGLHDPSIEALIDRAIEGNPPVIWLAGPPVWGAGIIDLVMEKGFHGRLVAPQSYGRMIPDDLFGQYTEKLNILWQVTATDSGTNGMPEFRKDFLHSYLREPDWMAALGYDAMACAGKFLQGEELTRKKMREHFFQYNSPENAFHGVGGNFYYDSKGYVQRTFELSGYRQGKLTPVNSIDESAGR